MGTAFVKSLKWCLLMVFAIGGIYGLSETSRLEDVRYIMISMLCFGSVYMLFRTWSELSGKIMIYSLCIVVGLGFWHRNNTRRSGFYYADIDVTEMMGFSVYGRP